MYHCLAYVNAIRLIIPRQHRANQRHARSVFVLRTSQYAQPCPISACTAVVTELAFHKKFTIDADISFLSELEWRQELEVLLHDLVDEGGGIKRITDLKSDAGVAWQKVRLTS